MDQLPSVLQWLGALLALLWAAMGFVERRIKSAIEKHEAEHHRVDGSGLKETVVRLSTKVRILEKELREKGEG